MYTWLDLPTLNLPETVKTALLEHLIAPFQSAAEAQSFWLESGTQLVYSAPPLDATIEFTDSLPECYQLSLVIMSDAGEGIYYLYKENSHGM